MANACLAAAPCRADGITHVQAGSVFGPRRTPKPKAPPVVNPPPPPAAASGVTHLPMLNPNWQLWWLHPPKCATSFRYSVLDYPWSPMRDKSFPFGNHQVLFPDIAAARNENKAKLVGFFRQPEERLMSGYLHMNATPPCCTEIGAGGARSRGLCAASSRGGPL